MRAEIISVGTELLLGDILNTNAQFLAQELASLGYTVYYQTVVGDNTVRLRSLILEAKERSDVLVFTGGLGPTDDDLTKETVAETFGDLLVVDHEELAKIEGFFKSIGREMTRNNVKQAMVPRNGKKLVNPNGTAPGAFFRQGNKYAFLLPGPPHEMEAMFTEEVRPVLEAMQDGAIRSHTMRVFGVGESELETRVQTLLEGSNPTAALYAKPGEVHIRITAQSGTPEHAEAMCAEYAALFRKVLGDVIYSENGEDLETTVVRALVETGQEVATAESCTGGLLSERLTSVPGASGVFGFGAVTYANDVKHALLGVKNTTLARYGAVSGQVAAEMAFGAAKKGGADFGIGITGIAGPDGGTEEKPVGLVYVALAQGGQVYVRKVNAAHRSRDIVRLMATQNALDMLRRAVAGLPIPAAKRFAKNQIADVERQGKPRRRGGAVARFFIALLAAVLLIGLVMGGLYMARENRPPEETVLPSETALQYGSAEYTRAACAAVASAAGQNPSVGGLITLPGAGLEELVVQTRDAQSALAVTDGRAGLEGTAALAADAKPGQAATNTLLKGGAAFEALHAFSGTGEQVLGTFTYYTARDAQVYEIVSVYLLEEDAAQPDGFSPAATALSGYEEYLGFVLGTGMRNLYALKTPPAPTDSYMTLCAEDTGGDGPSLFVCGRLTAPENALREVTVAPAQTPLLPAGAGRAQDIDELSAAWLRWLMDLRQDNQTLQIAAGMPAADKAPQEKPEPVEEPEDAGEQEAPAGEEAASDESGSASESAATQESGAAPSGQAPPEGGQPAPESAPQSSSAVAGVVNEMRQSADVLSSAGGGAENAGSQSESAAESAAQSESDPQSESGTGEVAPDSAQSRSASTGAAASRPAQTDVNRRPDPLYLTVTMNGEVVRAPVADVLAAICQREVGDAGPEVIKAQAVAAHSWILNQQGSGVAAPCVIGDEPTEAVRLAVAEVAKQVLSPDGIAPAFTPWYAMAANATNLPADVWGHSRGYLPSVSSPHEQGDAAWREIRTLPAAEVAALALQNRGIDLLAEPDPALWFTDLEKNDGGYVTSLKIGGVQVSGVDFWQEILAPGGTPLLASPAFEVRFEGESFAFTSYGAGHGVGMSQAGAAAMARDGKTFEEILAHYYPGAKLVAWE